MALGGIRLIDNEQISDESSHHWIGSYLVEIRLLMILSVSVIVNEQASPDLGLSSELDSKTNSVFAYHRHFRSNDAVSTAIPHRAGKLAFARLGLRTNRIVKYVLSGMLDECSSFQPHLS